MQSLNAKASKLNLICIFIYSPLYFAQMIITVAQYTTLWCRLKRKTEEIVRVKQKKNVQKPGSHQFCGKKNKLNQPQGKQCYHVMKRRCILMNNYCYVLQGTFFEHLKLRPLQRVALYTTAQFAYSSVSQSVGGGPEGWSRGA